MLVRQLRNLGALVMILALLVVACAAPAAQPAAKPAAEKPVEKAAQPAAKPTKVLKVGALIPLSGAQAAGGKDWQNAYELWKDTLNSKGGLNVGGERYNVEVVYYDYASNTDNAVKIADKLVAQDGIKFVFGPYGSMVVAAVAPVVEKYEALHLSFSSTTSIFEKGYKYSFSVLSSTDAQATDAFKLFASLNPKPKTMSLLARNDALPLAYLNTFKVLGQKYGIEVVQADTFPPDTTDLMTPLTAIKAKNADMLGFFGYRNDGILMAQQAAQIGLTPRIVVGQADWDAKSFRDALGDLGMGLMTFAPWVAELPEKYKDDLFGTAADFAKAHNAKYGYLPGYSGAGVAAKGLILGKSIERAGSLDTKKVRDEVAKFSADTFYGPVKFDSLGMLDRGAFNIQVQKTGLVVLGPDAKTGEMVYPFQWKKGSQ